MPNILEATVPIKIFNVSLDPAYDLKRRMATRLQMEPVIAGERLRLRQSRVLTDEQAKANKDWLAELERGGVIKIEKTKMSFDEVLPPPVAPPKEPKMEKPPEPPAPPVIPPELPAPPAPPAPLESVPLASSSETPSSSATTQPLPNMGSRKEDKKRR